MDAADSQFEIFEDAVRGNGAIISAADTETSDLVDKARTGEFENIAEERVSQGTESAPSGYAVLPPVNSGSHLAKAVEVEQVSASKIRPLGQLHYSFIIAVDDEGLLLIDQHVAHERILFDKFRKNEKDRAIESQNLLLPENSTFCWPNPRRFN